MHVFPSLAPENAHWREKQLFHEARRLAPIADKAQLGPIELGFDFHDLHTQHSIRWRTVLRAACDGSTHAGMGHIKRSVCSPPMMTEVQALRMDGMTRSSALVLATGALKRPIAPSGMKSLAGR